MALYSEKVMDHFLHPRNVGVLEDADGVGEVGNAKCGDIMKIYLKIDNDVISAAQDLGAGQWTILRRIIIPLSIPGVVSGITMVMVPSISEFVIASMLGGGKVYLIGNVIEQAFNSGYADIHAGSGLSLSLMVLILISMVIYRFFDGEEGESSLW